MLEARVINLTVEINSELYVGLQELKHITFSAE